MIPTLYSGDETEFTGNGIGRLSNAISCNVIERLNGAYELEMIYPINGIHYDDITMNSIIYSVHDDTGDKQPFEVYKITKPINGKVTVYAHHISYRLEKIPAFSLYPSAANCNQALTRLFDNGTLEECPFSHWTDITTVASNFGINCPTPLRTCLGGMEGSILDLYHCEYEWDKFTVKAHNHRGNVNTGITLKYGKNITDINQEEEISKTVTGVVPFWLSMDKTELQMLYNPLYYRDNQAVYSQYADRYPYHFTIPLDLSDKWETKPSSNDLRAAAEAYVNQNGLGIPRVSIDVSFVALWQTEEYKDIANLERVNLGDTINVEFEKLGIETTARVIETDYNVLKNRYNKIHVGSSRPTFTSVVNDQNVETITFVKKEAGNVGRAINQATAWLTSGNGYIVARKGSNGEWKELFAMDTPDIDTATKVMRLNENGIGGSSNGVDGPYEAALLVDGTIVASRVKTGVLSDLNGKFSLNMETGALSMRDGTFSGTINGSVINWGTAELGAKMSWEEIIPGSGLKTLVIEGHSNIPSYFKDLRLEFDNVAIDGNIGNAGHTITTQTVQTNSVNANSTITAAGKIYSEGYETSKDVTNQHVNIGVFESNGDKYLGVYKGTTSYGNVKLT